MHLWVHISNDEAKRMEEERCLLHGICYRVDDSMLEYHIDMHPEFQMMEPRLSVRMPPNTRPIIIVGQDETVLKQNSFSS